jgi:hypothetical protein
MVDIARRQVGDFDVVLSTYTKANGRRVYRAHYEGRLFMDQHRVELFYVRDKATAYARWLVRHVAETFDVALPETAGH